MANHVAVIERTKMFTSMEQHQMVLNETFPDGSQEWCCPVCGRRFIMHWPPNYKRIILDPGNEQVVHSGGTGGVVMGLAEIQPEEQLETSTPRNIPPEEEPGNPVEIDDPFLWPFIRWAEENKIDL
jgi:hypothetical protein